MHYRSIPYFSEREWTAMSHVTDKTLEVALLLLPVFCLIHFCFDYAQGFLDEEITFKALMRSLYSGVGLLLLLLSYPQFVEKLDWLIAALINAFDDKKAIEALLEEMNSALEDSQEERTAWLLNPLPSIVTWLKYLALKWGIPFLRAFLNYLRGYLLIFSTQVGPLAIAISMLPGQCGSALATWLNMHLSLLCWGITMGLLDLSLALVSNYNAPTVAAGLRDWLAAVAFGAMYLLVAPLTSIYIGHTMGNSLFTKSSNILSSQLLKKLPQSLVRWAKKLS